MGDSEQSVKNKVKVEGSICVSYLHRETTHFGSHYFNNFMLSPCNIRNEIAIETKRHPPTLSGIPKAKSLTLPKECILHTNIA